MHLEGSGRTCAKGSRRNKPQKTRTQHACGKTRSSAIQERQQPPGLGTQNLRGAGSRLRSLPHRQQADVFLREPMFHRCS